MRLYILTLITICLCNLLPAQKTTGVDCPTTETFTCIRRGVPYGEVSLSRPCDGAVFRIGEPVVFDPDPEFATGQFCQDSQPPYEATPAGVGRSISHSEIGTLTISEADSADTIAFNVPGTVTIRRHAGSFQLDSFTKVNTITIVDDGLEPVPAPVSVPLAGFVPKIKVEAYRDQDGFTGPNTATLDNSYSNLTGWKITNSGTGDLVLKEVLMVAYQGISEVRPVGFVKDTVIRPGQEYVLDFEEYIIDPDRYLDLKLEERILFTAMHSNDPDTPYARLGRGASQIVEGGVTGPPPMQPISGIPSICNDANNDGVIDIGDLVFNLLGGHEE